MNGSSPHPEGDWLPGDAASADAGLQGELEDRACDLFDEQLESLLSEGTTAEMLRKLSTVDERLSLESIRANVVEGRASVLDRVGSQLGAWVSAEQRLTEANRELDDAASASTVKVLAWLGVATAAAAIAVIAYLAFSSGSYSLLGASVFTTYFGAAPWVLADLRRTRRARELGVPARGSARDEAELRFLSTLADQLTVAIREAVNEAVTSHSTRFRMFDARGLRELADPEREVSISAGEELESLMTSLSSGSIGLAGPRGAGKTTLMNSFTRGRSVLFNKERVGLTVAAPVKYDAREFVLHLFGSLCERVIGDDRLDEISSTGRERERELRTARIGRALIGGAAVLAAVAGLILVFNKTAPESPRETAYLMLGLAVGGAYVGLLLWLGSSRTASRGMRRMIGISVSPETSPEWVAQEQLEQIRYQQTVTTGRSGTLELPLGLKLGSEVSTTRSPTPWSLPEAVEAFRRYAARVAKDRYVVIGIDELDKMESGDAARQFLNNVKGVFGVRGCYYLISVSEDAMSSFERRGVPFRDVFDSAFDAIQPVGYLSLAESRTLLETRVTGLPVPFQHLCHCLSGGLPRDLIRTTRELTHQQSAKDLRGLEELARAVVRAEYRGKVAAAVEATRTMRDQDTEWLAAWLSELDPSEVDVVALREHCTLLSHCPDLHIPPQRGGESGTKPREIAIEMAVLDYYSATVLELFGAEARFADLVTPPSPGAPIDPQAVLALEALAKARRDFSVNPWLAWRSINSVCRAVDWLDPWADPRGSGGGWPTEPDGAAARV